VNSADLVSSLRLAGDAELLNILASADAADVAMRDPRQGLAEHRRVVAAGTTEIVLLGAMGCRYGMLAGGAGGHLVRTATTTVLVDPGPAALDTLVALAGRELFDWRELDAIAVSHFHPDHYGDLIPTIEAMTSYAAPGVRKTVLANPTTAERFGRFSPYHLGGMTDLVTLAHARTAGSGRPSATVGDITVQATPALHTEEAERRHSALGFVYRTPAVGIWYTSDTNLSAELLGDLAELISSPALVIAHADASNVTPSAERAVACHLQSRDVPVLAAALNPRHVVIQHYDMAYSEPGYRIAQAMWIQRRLRERGEQTTVLPGANGLRLVLAEQRLVSTAVALPSEAGYAVECYLRGELD